MRENNLRRWRCCHNEKTRLWEWVEACIGWDHSLPERADSQWFLTSSCHLIFKDLLWWDPSWQVYQLWLSLFWSHLIAGIGSPWLHIPSQQLQCTLSGDTLENDQQLEWEQNMMNSLLAGARYKNHKMHVLRDFHWLFMFYWPQFKTLKSLGSNYLWCNFSCHESTRLLRCVDLKIPVLLDAQLSDFQERMQSGKWHSTLGINSLRGDGIPLFQYLARW